MHMALKYVLLTLLNREPQSGYEIVKTFESSVGYFWNASHQQVYRELSGLTDKKLVRFVSVKQEDKPDKKIYRATANGKRALHSWLQTPLQERPAKNLLLVKLLNLNDENLDLMLAELDQVLERCSERQKIYQNIERTYYPAKVKSQLSVTDLPLYLALRQGITALESHLLWLSEARREINKRNPSTSD